MKDMLVQFINLPLIPSLSKEGKENKIFHLFFVPLSKGDHRGSTMKIACDFHWEMGHRLPEHAGGCKNVHGHSYNMRVEIDGEVQRNGMVMDFFDIKKIVQPLVEKLDHSFLCSETDMLMKNFLAKAKMKCVLVPFQTTAENIARYFLDAIRPRLKKVKHLRRISVRVAETESSFAEAAEEIGEWRNLKI